MENTSRLYDTLVAALGQSLPWRDRRHLQTLAWMLVGWLSAAQAGLCAWIPYVQSRAQQAQSVQRRFHRWLANERIDAAALYGPLIQAALAQWEETQLYLALDTTLLWDQLCLVRVAVIYRGRAVPLVWQTLGYSSNAVAFDTYAPLLRQAARLLPPSCVVTLLADRGFADVRLLQLLDTELHWHWRIRLKHHITVRRHGFYRQRLTRVLPPPGHACFWHNVYVFEERYGPVHLALARPPQAQDEWIVLSDSPTSPQTFAEYGLRFDIEENFLDDKSNGFQLQASQLRVPHAVHRLVLVLAVATLFLVAQGTAVVAAGQRRRIDPHWQRGYSYLHIGWHYLQAALVHGWPLVTPLVLSATPDPAPAYASKRQHKSKLPTFTVETTVFRI
jgi:hypothetical protein